MTVKEIREALDSFRPDDNVLVFVDGESRHDAIKSVGLSLGGCPTIHSVRLPAGKAAPETLNNAL